MAKLQYRLRSKDVAHYLDMSPDDVLVLVKKNQIRGIKKGRYWKFDFSSVKRWKTKTKKEKSNGRRN